MATATASPNIDLGNVIKTRQAELNQLMDLQRQQQEIGTRITLLLSGRPADPAVTQQMRLIESTNGNHVPVVKPRVTRARNERKLGDILHDYLIEQTKVNPSFSVTVKEATSVAQTSGYVTKSNNFFNTVRQLLVTDKRFKSHKIRGTRNVMYGLRPQAH